MGFAICYAFARVVLAGIFLRVGVHERQSRSIAWSYGGSAALVAVMVSVSIVAPPRIRIALWAMAVAIEMLTPMVVSASVKRLLPHRRATSKLPERFGLFTIIVLGETFVGVFQGLSQTHHLTLVDARIGLMGLAMAFALWSVYFDFVARRSPREGVWWEYAWGYSHLALLMSIVVVGACLYHVIVSGESALPEGVRWLLAGATCVALCSVAVLELTLEASSRARRNVQRSAAVKVVVGMAALMAGFTGQSVGAGRMLAILLVCALIPVVLGVRLWIREHGPAHSGRA